MKGAARQLMNKRHDEIDVSLSYRYCQAEISHGRLISRRTNGQKGKSDSCFSEVFSPARVVTVVVSAGCSNEPAALSA